MNIYGNQLDELGMLVDFRDLKATVNKIMINLDHYCLNEIEPFCKINPTAENIAKYIYDELLETKEFDQEVKLRSIRIWESATSAATYSQEA